jgi:hypothetical protein
VTTFAGNEAMPTAHFDALRELVIEHALPLRYRALAIQQGTGQEPTAFVLPQSCDPGIDPADMLHRPVGEPVEPLRMFGTPVMWDPEERMGLFYEVTP